MSSGDKSAGESSEQTPLIAPSSDAAAESNTVLESAPPDPATGAEVEEGSSGADVAGTVADSSPYQEEDVGAFTKGCHMFFVGICTISIVILTCMSISQIILLSNHSVPFLQFSLRMYLLIFCVVFILVEFDWPRAIMRTLPTQNWLMRGWIYSFLGLVGMEEAFAVLVSNSASSDNILASDLVSVFIQISSWGMVGIGIGYFALGLLCMRGLKEKVRKDYYEAKARRR